MKQKMIMERGVCLFLKYPEPGNVKTRLAKTIGDSLASELYKCFVMDIISKIKALDCHLHLFVAPARTPGDELEGVKQWLKGTYPMHVQKGDGLGQRMKNAFNAMFKLGYQRTILIGSDSPDLPMVVPREAFKALAHSSSVIAPSHDGGYYLIGFQQNRMCEAVFDNVEWSTQRVFQQTMSLFNQQGVFPRIMLEWHDIDDFDDLKALVERHKEPNDPFNRSHTMKYIQAHKQGMSLGIGD